MKRLPVYAAAAVALVVGAVLLFPLLVERAPAVEKWYDARVADSRVDRVISCANKQLTYATVVGGRYTGSLLILFANIISSAEVDPTDQDAIRADYDGIFVVAAECALKQGGWEKLNLVDVVLEPVATLDDGGDHVVGYLLYFVALSTREDAEALVEGRALLPLLKARVAELSALGTPFYQIPVTHADVRPELVRLAVERANVRNAEILRLRAEGG